MYSVHIIRAGANLFGVVRPRDCRIGLQLPDVSWHANHSKAVESGNIYRKNGCPKIELGNYLLIGLCNTLIVLPITI